METVQLAQSHELCLATAVSGVGCFKASHGRTKQAAIKKAKRRLRKVNNPLMQPSKTATELNAEEVAKFDPYVKAAKAKEIKSWQTCKAYEAVRLDSTKHNNVLTGRWVLTFKPASADWKQKRATDPTICDDGRRVKARYVVRGYLEEKVDGTGNPTASRDSVPLALSWAAGQNHGLELGDVSTAFLQGEPLSRDVQVRICCPSEWGLQENQVLALNRAVYGLKDAPALLYAAFRKVAERLGGEVLMLDEGLIKWTGPVSGSGKGGVSTGADSAPDKDVRKWFAPAPKLDELGGFHHQSETDRPAKGIAVLHVDDCIFTGDDDFFRHFVREGLREAFPFGPPELASEVGGVKYTGTQFFQHEHGIKLDQAGYIENLMLVPIKGQTSRKLVEQEQDAFRSLLGALQWLV